VNGFSDLEDRCEKELAAADRAVSQEARVAHLEWALRYALLAVKSHPMPAPVEIMEWRREHCSSSARPPSEPTRDR